jgi:hypothetical protein
MPLNPNAGGFDPNAGAFVPGGASFTVPTPAPAAEPAPDPAPAPAAAPAPEAKEETWESEPNVDSAPAAAGEPAEEAAEAVEDLQLDDEMKKELAAMKAEGLIDDEEEAEITSGKVRMLSREMVQLPHNWSLECCLPERAERERTEMEEEREGGDILSRGESDCSNRATMLSCVALACWPLLLLSTYCALARRGRALAPHRPSPPRGALSRLHCPLPLRFDRSGALSTFCSLPRVYPPFLLPFLRDRNR